MGLSLLRICNVHNVPLASNMATADLLIHAIAANPGGGAGAGGVGVGGATGTGAGMASPSAQPTGAP